MKVKMKVEKEIELEFMQVNAKPSYWEDSYINGQSDTEGGDNVPCKQGEMWRPKIHIDSGHIVNWKTGIKASIHYKVCDLCGWELLDIEGETVLYEKDGYVPNTLSPKENGYGDYIIMDIDENGNIQDWKFDITDFINED